MNALARALERRPEAPRLGLDSATATLSLALWWPASGRCERRSLELGRALGGRLALEVDAFLRDHQVAPQSLGGIGVGVGPGSFTGARIGVAWALAVGRVLRVPVVGGDTVEALAAAALEPGAEGWVAVATRRHRALASRYARDSSGALRLLEGPLELALDAALGAGPQTVHLGHPPDALQHAQRVDAADAAPPAVRYGDAEPA